MSKKGSAQTKAKAGNATPKSGQTKQKAQTNNTNGTEGKEEKVKAATQAKCRHILCEKV
jgi:hypothetical protein